MTTKIKSSIDDSNCSEVFAFRLLYQMDWMRDVKNLPEFLKRIDIPEAMLKRVFDHIPLTAKNRVYPKV